MTNGSKLSSTPDGPQGPSPKRRWPGLRVSCSPSPQPSPRGEGETFAPALIIRSSSIVVCLRNERQKRGGLQPQRPNSPAGSQHSASPRGEGWGEGEGSDLQPEAHDDSRNCQTSRVPRQNRAFPNLIMNVKFHAMIPVTTLPSTSVRRKSRPPYR